MKILLIYANYKENSFTSSISNLVAETFHKNGHEVVIRNLYEIKFNPVLSKNDLESIEKEIFPYDIMQEQKFIQWADFICFVYPIWWSGMPAILKGYIERVFVQGYAFNFVDGEIIPKLSSKKIAIFNTTSLKNLYNSQKALDALNTITEDCVFGFSGMNTIAHKYFKAISKPSAKEIENSLNEVRTETEKILKSLE